MKEPFNIFLTRANLLFRLNAGFNNEEALRLTAETPSIVKLDKSEWENLLIKTGYINSGEQICTQ